jgi:hypothetical protein
LITTHDDRYREAMPGSDEAHGDTPRSVTLRNAIQSAHAQGDHAPAPEFSADGGGSVFDNWGRRARVQPLGTRTRITLSEDDRMQAEGEVDTDYLIDRISTSDATYVALAAVLNEENGPGTRSN